MIIKPGRSLYVSARFLADVLRSGFSLGVRIMREQNIFDSISQNTGQNYGGTVHQLANFAAERAKTWKQNGHTSYTFTLRGTSFCGNTGGQLICELADDALGTGLIVVKAPKAQQEAIEHAILHRTVKTCNVKVPTMVLP